MSARELKIKQKGIIKEIVVEDKQQRQRLLDLGFIPGTEISCYRKIFGSSAFEVKGSVFGLRNEMAKDIILES